MPNPVRVELPIQSSNRCGDDVWVCCEDNQLLDNVQYANNMPLNDSNWIHCYSLYDRSLYVQYSSYERNSPSSFWPRSKKSRFTNAPLRGDRNHSLGPVLLFSPWQREQIGKHLGL